MLINVFILTNHCMVFIEYIHFASKSGGTIYIFTEKCFRSNKPNTTRPSVTYNLIKKGELAGKWDKENKTV